MAINCRAFRLPGQGRENGFDLMKAEACFNIFTVRGHIFYMIAHFEKNNYMFSK